MRKCLLAVLLLILLCAACAARAEAPVGDTVVFGAFEQDGDPENGPEPIEWLVLDARDGALLLISRRVLDAQPFHARNAVVTWEACSLRAWLNGEFLEAAFTPEERGMILLTELDNGPTQSDLYCMDGGAATMDRVFLLSFAESAQYFSADEERICAPTPSALARGARVNENNPDPDGNPACWWWLRSPGYYRYNAAAVLAGGARTNHSGVDAKAGGVRPVIWLKMGEAGE